MSYDKIKSIRIDETEGKVFLNVASSNCFPITYYKEEAPFFSKILKEEGRGAVEIRIMENYESGNFQQGTNKYTKAMKVLRYVFGEEYKKFNWRTQNAKYGTPEREEEEKLRKSQEFKDLLKKCLDYKFPKNRFVIFQNHSSYCGDSKIYGKSCPTCMKWVRKEKATKFDFEEEARDHIFEKFKDVWEVEEF